MQRRSSFKKNIMGSFENIMGPSVCELETGSDSNYLLFKKFKYQPKGLIGNSRENEEEMSSSSEPPSTTATTAESLDLDAKKMSASAAAGAPAPASETLFNQPDLQPRREKPAYLIRWNQFEEQVCNAFSELFCSDHFVDVTLACEGELLKSHKIVLAMSSPFFRRIFQETPCKHPVVIIKGMSSKTLRNILQYIYLGEVVLDKADINSFMDAADYLSICGVLAQLYSCDISTANFKESKIARESEQSEDSKHSEATGLTSENEDIGEDGELQIDEGSFGEKEKPSSSDVESRSQVIKYHGVKSRWSRRYSNTSYHGTPTTTSPVVDEQKRSASAGELESVLKSYKSSANTEGSRVSPVQPLVDVPSDVEMIAAGDDSESYEEPPTVTPDPESRRRNVIQRAHPKQYGHMFKESMETNSEAWRYHSQGQYPPVFSAATSTSTSVTRTHQQPPYHLGAKDFSHPLQVSVEPHSQTLHAASSTSTSLDPHPSTKAKFHSGFTLYTSSHQMSSQRSMHRTHSESDFPPLSSPIPLVSSQGREHRGTKHRQLSGSASTAVSAYGHPEYASRTHLSLLSTQALQFPGTHRTRAPYTVGSHREQLEGRYRQEEREMTGYGTPKDFLQQSNIGFGVIATKPHSFPSARDLSVPMPHPFALGYVPQLKSPPSSSASVAPSAATRPKTKAIRSSQVPQSSRYTAAEVDMMVDAVANYPGNIVPCTLCQKFVKRERLRAHIHECHLLTGEKIICPHCGIALKSKGSFRVHIWRHKRGALPTRSTMSDFDRDRPPSPTAGPASH